MVVRKVDTEVTLEVVAWSVVFLVMATSIVNAEKNNNATKSNMQHNWHESKCSENGICDNTNHILNSTPKSLKNVFTDQSANDAINGLLHFFYITPNNASNRRDGRKHGFLNYQKLYGIRYNPGDEVKLKKESTKNSTHSPRKCNESILITGVDTSIRNQLSIQQQNVSDLIDTAIPPVIMISSTTTTMSPQAVIMVLQGTTMSSEATTMSPQATFLPSQASTSTIQATTVSHSTTMETSAPSSTMQTPGVTNMTKVSHWISSGRNKTYVPWQMSPTHNISSTGMYANRNYIQNVVQYFGSKLWQLFNYGLQLEVPWPQIDRPRFLNLFNVIKFDNIPCKSNQPMLTEMSGTCYHAEECNQMGGVAVDNCADGFGVCCACKCLSWCSRILFFFFWFFSFK